MHLFLIYKRIINVLFFKIFLNLNFKKYKYKIAEKTKILLFSTPLLWATNYFDFLHLSQNILSHIQLESSDQISTPLANTNTQLLLLLSVLFAPQHSVWACDQHRFFNGRPLRLLIGGAATVERSIERLRRGWEICWIVRAIGREIETRVRDLLRLRQGFELWDWDWDEGEVLRYFDQIVPKLVELVWFLDCSVKPAVSGFFSFFWKFQFLRKTGPNLCPIHRWTGWTGRFRPVFKTML